MIIRRLIVEDFNGHHANAAFGSGLNVVCGNDHQLNTLILDLLAHLTGPRFNPLFDGVRFGSVTITVDVDDVEFRHTSRAKFNNDDLQLFKNRLRIQSSYTIKDDQRDTSDTTIPDYGRNLLRVDQLMKANVFDIRMARFEPNAAGVELSCFDAEGLLVANVLRWPLLDHPVLMSHPDRLMDEPMLIKYAKMLIARASDNQIIFTTIYDMTYRAGFWMVDRGCKVIENKKKNEDESSRNSGVQG